MAARTASVTGNWNDTATWGGAAVPVSGDTVTINDGITVTIPTGYFAVVGASPGDDVSTPAIQCASSTGTGILNGQDGAGLTIKGTVKQANATWTFGSGSGTGFALVHDSSAGAGTPSYTWQVGMAANQANAKLVINGASGSRASITNGASSGRFGGFHNGATGRNGTRSPGGAGNNGAGRCQFSQVTMTGVGSTATEAFTIDLAGSLTAPTFSLDNVIMDDCGAIIVLSSMKGDAVFTLNASNTINPAQTNKVCLCIALPVAKTTGTRTITDCVLEGQIQGVGLNGANSAHGFVMTRSAFGGVTGAAPFDFDGGNGFDMAMTDCLVWNRRSTGVGGDLTSGTHTRLSCWRSGLGGDDDMWRYTMDFLRDMSMAGAVYSHDATIVGGEFLVVQNNPSSTVNVSAQNILAVPSPTGTSAGNLVVAVAAGGTLANQRVTVRRCTNKVGGADKCIFDLENTTGGAGCVVAVEDNIAWASSAATTLVVDKTGSGTLDAATITVARNNATPNNSGDAYTPTDDKFGSPPGSGDITTAPSFADTSRTALTWASTVSGGSVTTLAGAWAEIKKKNTTSYNSAYDWYATGTGFYDWVRAGFAPGAAAYATGAHDGSYIGAVPPVTSRPRAHNHIYLRNRI